jgi:hypothetical protein
MAMATTTTWDEGADGEDGDGDVERRRSSSVGDD